MEGKEQPQADVKTPSKKDKKNKKNKNKNKAVQPKLEPSKQQDFDYSNVDFNQFGGGSIVEQKNEIKMKFHGKVSRTIFLEIAFFSTYFFLFFRVKTTRRINNS